MKSIGKFLCTLTSLCLILVTGCQKKDDVPELNSRILFSIDLGNQEFPYYRQAYLAAYTSDGKFLNYGSLADSSKWELKGLCRDDKIDILYFEIYNQSNLIIDHFKNVTIGQLFGGPNSVVYPSVDYYHITLKIEDFGNRSENNTSLTYFESKPYDFSRGYTNSVDMYMDRIDDRYTYSTAFIMTDPRDRGHELLIFERGTNEPFVYSLDFPANYHSRGDTLTLNKSDFTKGEVKTIRINSSSNKFGNISLYTFNSKVLRRGLITSFSEDYIPDGTGYEFIKYVASDLLPINYWKFSYTSSSYGSTSYSIQCNKEIPSTIEIKEKLTGYNITSSENQFYFTHSPVFPDKNLVRSKVSFSKGADKNIIYNLHFDGSETVGSITISPFEIPDDILAKQTEYTDFLEIDSLDWNAYQYSQTYTNLPDKSPLEFLNNSLLFWNDNISSTSDYTLEEFSVNLR